MEKRILGQVWNQGNITNIYENWTNYCTGVQIQNNVIHLNGGEPWTDGFCDQGIGNPSIISNQDYSFYIYLTADDSLQDTGLIDAIYLIQRMPNGNYKLMSDGCAQSSDPILQFERDPDQRPYPLGNNGGKVGWMGQGMWTFYSNIPDYCGHHYFGIIPVFDRGDRECENNDSDCYDYRFNDDKVFLAWAFSSDGKEWWFKKDTNFTIAGCDNSSWYTDDPKLAFPVFYRDCFQIENYNDQWGREVFHHLAVFYSDPSKYDSYGNFGDGYVYIFFGYTPGDGAVWNFLARVKYDPNERDGLGQIELFKNDSDGPYCPSSGNWVVFNKCIDHSACHNDSINCGDTYSNGCISCNLIGNLAFKNQYIYDMAVPMDIIPVYKGNLLKYLILFYKSGSSFNSGGRIAMRFSKNIKPPFHFSEEKNLGSCIVSLSGYFPCGASSEGIGLVQPPCTEFWKNLGYYDQNCNPLALLGYINATITNCTDPQGNPLPINFQPEGILPTKVTLTNSNWVYDIYDLKITKLQNGKLRLYWSPIFQDGQNCKYMPDGKSNCTYRIVEGSFDEDFKKDGSYCPSYENVIYDHRRKEYLIENTYYDISLPEGNTYFLVYPVCNERIIPDKQGNPFLCYASAGGGGPPYYSFTLNYLSEGTSGYNSNNIERFIPICELPEYVSNCQNYWPQPGDQGR